MNILFIGLASSYTDGTTYQDELLAEQCVRDGHQVTYIANANKIVNGDFLNTEEEDVVLSNGIRLIRLKYDRILNSFFSKKIRKCSKISELLGDIQPDAIYIHGPATISVKYVARYIDQHKNVKLYMDSHTDYYTSGTNLLSRLILHRGFYRYTHRICLKYADKLFCVSSNCMKFANEIYKIPMNRMEFYPLGGIVAEDYISSYEKMRLKFGYKNDEIIFIQAGKIDEHKCLLESLQEFMRIQNDRWRYIIVGSASDGIKPELDKCIEQDDRIEYVGWKNGDELVEYLSAADIYVQPGKVSAIMQNALCVGTPVIVRRFDDYIPYIEGNDNGWLIESMADLFGIYKQIDENKINLKYARKCAHDYAAKMLDYRMLAKKIY